MHATSLTPAQSFDVTFRSLALTALAVDPALQARAGGIDQATAGEYGQALKEGKKLPPVVVFGPDETARFWLADGFHRVAGAKIRDLREIAAEIHPGGRREALLFSLGANATHGLRRTQADKRKAVLTLLEDAEWCQWGDRVIAEKAAVSHVLVWKLRKELNGSTVNINNRDPHPESAARGDEAPTVNINSRLSEDKGRGKDGRLYLRRRPQKSAPVREEPAMPHPCINTDERGVAPVPQARPVDHYAAFQRQFAQFMAGVPEEKLHMIAVQLRNLGDDIDPEFQEKQRAHLAAEQARGLGLKASPKLKKK